MCGKYAIHSHSLNHVWLKDQCLKLKHYVKYNGTLMLKLLYLLLIKLWKPFAVLVATHQTHKINCIMASASCTDSYVASWISMFKMDRSICLSTESLYMVTYYNGL